jgi:hypothetical protein
VTKWTVGHHRGMNTQVDTHLHSQMSIELREFEESTFREAEVARPGNNNVV